MRKNTGELPQYYVENSHEPIITKAIHEEVLRRWPQFRHRHHSTLPFSGLLFCSECGYVFMPLPAHSTTYNDVIWKCTGRHLHHSSCTTPSLYEEMLLPIFHEIILSILQDNPGIVRECINALKAVSNTPTAFRKDKIMDLVTAYNFNTKTEVYLWRTVIEKVLVHPGHLLEFHLRNGTVIPYQMLRISPRTYRLSKTAPEEIRNAYANGEPICSIAKRHNIPEDTIRSVIRKRKGPP